VRVGQKIDADRRKDLLAKAEKMAVRMRQSFLELDTSGDSRLDPEETLAMFQQSEAALAPVSFSAPLRIYTEHGRERTRLTNTWV
jgi:hypothetical protein